MAPPAKAITKFIVAVISSLGYPGVFLCMFMESACLPIPSEIVLVFAGFVAAQGELNIFGVMLSGVAGALSGASAAYALARYGGRPVLLRYGRWAFITERRLDSVENWFRQRGQWSALFCRWITGLRAIVSLPAGLARMPYGRFIALTFVGSGSWVVFAVVLGVCIGEEWPAIVTALERFRISLLILIAVALLVWMLCRARRRRLSGRADKVAAAAQHLRQPGEEADGS